MGSEVKPMSRSTAWKKANPERHREYMREYMRKRRARSSNVNVPNP